MKTDFVNGSRFTVATSFPSAVLSRMLALCCAISIAFAASPALLADYLPGVTATTDMGSGFNTTLSNTLNGVGLSSVSLAATHAGTSPANSWVSQTALTGQITFNLGGSRAIRGFSFWNQNNGGPGAAGSTGIRGVTILSSTDGVTFTPIAGAVGFFNQVTVGSDAAPQIVTFASAVLATHIRFTVLSNWGDTGQTGFAEVGFDRGTALPEIAVEQPEGTDLTDGVGTVNFGSTLVGTSSERIFTIRNPGTADLTGLTTTISGTKDFSVTVAPAAPVRPGGSTSFTVRFTPSPGSGPRTATLRISSNDANENPFDIALAGEAIPDTTAPETTITSAPSGTVGSDSATIVFEANEPANFRGSLDGGPLQPVSSPLTLNGLADGQHTFSVFATDPSGNADASPASVTWTVDTTAPDLVVPAEITVPEMSVNGAVVNFEVSASDAIDPEVAATATPASGSLFPIGTTTVNVTATDDTGNTAGRSFTVTVLETETAALAGQYALLVGDESGPHAAVSLTIGARNLLTGTVRNDRNVRTRIPTTFVPASNETTLALSDGSTLTLRFDRRGHVVVTLTTQGVAYLGDGEVSPTTAPEGVAGKYTMGLDAGDAGAGWCTLVVSSRGNVRFAGRMPDGAPMASSQGLLVDRDSDTPVFLIGTGLTSRLTGSLHFADETASDATGALTLTIGGARTACAASGAKFTPAASALPPGSYPITLSGAGVSLVSDVTLTAGNAAVVASPLVSLKPGGGSRPANGIFHVKFRTSTATPSLPIHAGSGVFIQKTGSGFGQFIKEGQVGRVEFGPVVPAPAAQ